MHESKVSSRQNRNREPCLDFHELGGDPDLDLFSLAGPLGPLHCYTLAMEPIRRKLEGTGGVSLVPLLPGHHKVNRFASPDAPAWFCLIRGPKQHGCTTVN